MLMYGSPSSINERVKRHIHRARSTFICWHRDSLIQTYGEDIIPYVWELVIVLQGLLRECITLIKLEKNRSPWSRSRSLSSAISISSSKTGQPKPLCLKR